MFIRAIGLIASTHLPKPVIADRCLGKLWIPSFRTQHCPMSNKRTWTSISPSKMISIWFLFVLFLVPTASVWSMHFMSTSINKNGACNGNPLSFPSAWHSIYAQLPIADAPVALIKDLDPFLILPTISLPYVQLRVHLLNHGLPEPNSGVYEPVRHLLV